MSEPIFQKLTDEWNYTREEEAYMEEALVGYMNTFSSEPAYDLVQYWNENRFDEGSRAKFFLRHKFPELYKILDDLVMTERIGHNKGDWHDRVK